MHLPRKLSRHRWVISHDIAVARVRNQDEFPLWECTEDLLEQVFAYAEGFVDVAEIEGTRVEGSAGVRLVDEIHVIARDLLGRGGQVVEVEVRDTARPVGVDIRHVHPRRKRTRERVQQTFLGLVDFGDAEDIVNIVDDGEAGRGHEVSGRVAGVCAVSVDIQTLDLRSAVPGGEALAIDVDEAVEVAFVSCGNGELDDLTTALGSDGSSSALFTRGTCRWRWAQAERHILVLLLQNVDLRRQVSGLRGLRRWKRLYGCADQETVCEFVELRLGNVWLFEDIAMKAQVPALVSPVPVAAANC